MFILQHNFLTFLDNQVRPSVFQPCELSPCAEPQKNGEKLKPDKNSAYKWDYGPWGPCSAACLSGNIFFETIKIIENQANKSLH